MSPPGSRSREGAPNFSRPDRRGVSGALSSAGSTTSTPGRERAQAIHLCLRVLQTLLAIANLGFASYVVHWYLTSSLLRPPSEVNFLVFAPIWSILSLIYAEFIGHHLPPRAGPWVALAVESLNVIFYFAGFIAFAAFLSVLTFCFDFVCAAARIVAVVAAAEFVAWTAMTVLLAMKVYRDRRAPPSSLSQRVSPEMGQARGPNQA